MTLSPENTALVWRVIDPAKLIYLLDLEDLNRLLDAARREGRDSVFVQYVGRGVRPGARP